MVRLPGGRGAGRQSATKGGGQTAARESRSEEGKRWNQAGRQVPGQRPSGNCAPPLTPGEVRGGGGGDRRARAARVTLHLRTGGEGGSSNTGSGRSGTRNFPYESGRRRAAAASASALPPLGWSQGEQSSARHQGLGQQERRPFLAEGGRRHVLKSKGSGRRSARVARPPPRRDCGGGGVDTWAARQDSRSGKSGQGGRRVSAMGAERQGT